MIRFLIRVTVVIFFFMSCSVKMYSQISTTGDDGKIFADVVNVKYFNKFIYEIDNIRADKIGFKLYEDDESMGVKALCIDGDYVYITDQVHSSVKKINIFTGVMQSSISINNASSSINRINDVAIFNGLAYVPAYDTLYIFSKNLELVRAVKAKRCEKYIEKIDDSGLYIYLNATQQKNLTVVYDFLLAKSAGSIKSIKTSVPIDVYTQESKKKTIQGKQYDIVQKNNRYYFQCKYGLIELKEQIQTRNRYYGYRNVNFNSTTLAYFESTPTAFTLYVYQW